MLRKLLNPNEYLFWTLAAFFNFYFFYRTSQGDFVHGPKLVAEGVIIISGLIFSILAHSLNLRSLIMDRALLAIIVASILYGLWITLTNTVFSSAPSYTLLGWPGWFSGYCLYLLCLLYFLVPATNSKMKGFSIALFTLFWLSGFTVLLCVLENIGFDILLSSSLFQNLMHYKFNTHTASFPVLTVGNSGYIGSIWLLFLPLPIILIFKDKLYQAMAWWLMLSVGLASTHSKISIIVSLLFFTAMIFYVFKIHFENRADKTVIIICIFLSMIIASLGNSAMVSINSFLFSHSFVSRNSKSSFDVSHSFRDRLYIWQGSLNAWKIRPATGWGLETLQNTFFDYVPQSTLDHYGKVFAQKTEDENVRHFGSLLVIVPKNGKQKILRQVITYNVKPHNYFIEELYSNGIIGLLLLVLLLALVTRYCWQSNSLESRLLLIGFGMYLIYLCGWFLTIAVSPLAFTLLGFAVHLAAQKRAENRQLLRTSAPAFPDTV